MILNTNILNVPVKEEDGLDFKGRIIIYLLFKRETTTI